MLDELDRSYFAMRAREERDRQASCKDASIAAVHRIFAEQYERRVRELAAFCSTDGDQGAPAF